MQPEYKMLVNQTNTHVALSSDSRFSFSLIITDNHNIYNDGTIEGSSFKEKLDKATSTCSLEWH